jgi:DNA processing protein
LPVPADARLWFALEAVPGLGAENARRLLAHFGGIAAVFAAPLGALRAVLGDNLADAVRRAGQLDLPEPAAAWLAAPDAHFIACTDPAYPPLLDDLPGAPAWLYVKGDPAALRRPLLAIVGSRNATPQGRRDAAAFAQHLAEAGLTIVSGLAEGIDSAAHEGGLAGNASGVAVVGTGLDRVYPAKNRDLAHRLAGAGALVSEFALGTPPRPGHFPRRNRLISGLSLGVLVVEAAPQSGSLITARLAGEQGREVFAMPGSIHSPLSKGCHQLIRQGAKLVESAEDILEELRGAWAPMRAAPPAPANDAAPEADTPEARLLSLLDSTPTSLDALLARSGLTVDRLSAILLTLELEGRVASLPGGRYQRQY